MMHPTRSEPRSGWRILEVTQRYPPALGGVEREVEAVVRELVARGYSVRVVTTDLARDRPFARLGSVRGVGPVPVRRCRALRLFPAPHGLGIVAPGMALELLAADADIVHAHAFGMAPTWLATWARRLRRLPVIIETHADAGRGTGGSEVYQRIVTRLTLRHADRVVAHTRSEVELLAAWGVDVARVALIPNGIDLAEFGHLPAPAARAPGVTLLFVGRLYPEQKGLIPLVRALALVPPALGVRLRLVGEDWGGAAPVRSLARELGVDARVEVTGPRSREGILEEYANADIFVLPSLFEPFGVVLLEAMAAGLPVIATRVGGIPEVVKEDSTALLVPPDRPPELAAAISQLASDPGLRSRLGRAGRGRVPEFSWTEVMPKWTALFDEVGRRPM